MSRADILARLYKDRVTVRRPVRRKLPSKETVFETEMVYTDIPCNLRKPSGGRLNQTEIAATAPMEYILLARPEIRIEAGDKLTVRVLADTPLEVVKEFVAGEPAANFSHIHVPVKLVREMV